ncbi:hypothetical protein [Undibacterium pigrum]|uniref:Uncharacterized protein n=1 Tax=Undibacterium pigrum TaxID=401470 RepID=A0A318IWX0_9BURK|nr:hypothetical protein [Undibacterium pigrum]PXX34945.1 hypothetical protein DFR42_12424 [Undibacterium pigrum]
MWNYSLNEVFERGIGYGQSEAELRYALKAKHNLVMLKVLTHEEPLWKVLMIMFFWAPLIWWLLFFPVFMLLFLPFADTLAISASERQNYALLLAYVCAFRLSVRKQSPLRDYWNRKKFVGTKTLTLDFHQQCLVAEEVYRFAPEKIRVQTVAFDKMYVFVAWHKGDKETDESMYEDSASIYLRLKSGGLKHMDWVNRKIEQYIFIHEYDSTDAAQTAEAKEKVDDIMALLKSQNLHPR